MTLKGLTHISLSVSDLDRSLAFYRDLLGLSVLAEPFEGAVFEGREAMLLIGRVALCLQAHSANTGGVHDPTVTGLDHLAFAVETPDDLAGWASKLTDAGVEHSGVKPLPGFGTMIELRDPDGILVELHCMAG